MRPMFVAGKYCNGEPTMRLSELCVPGSPSAVGNGRIKFGMSQAVSCRRGLPQIVVRRNKIYITPVLNFRHQAQYRVVGVDSGEQDAYSQNLESSSVDCSLDLETIRKGKVKRK